MTHPTHDKLIWALREQAKDIRHLARRQAAALINEADATAAKWDALAEEMTQQKDPQAGGG